uniref:Uncharacterized protein n=1 Tax=viral metagenome TaxID=1070528 RepID=A0A6C0H506_9ZZZZ
MLKKKEITYSTCWYRVKSKFAKEKYIEWMNNFMYIASFNNFNLVIYTNLESWNDIPKNNGENIKIVIIEFDNFLGNKYKNKWIKNKEKAINIQEKENDWKLNMIWSEKINFVYNTIKQNLYTETEYYGWCDIGYFRNRINDLSVIKMVDWSKNMKCLENEKIHYGWIERHGIAGGFFIINKNNIKWLLMNYFYLLEKSFNEDKYVKDDQQILLELYNKNKIKFKLHYENFAKYDSWFMFQRILF